MKNDRARTKQSHRSGMIEIDMRVVGELVLALVLAVGGISEAQTADDRASASARTEYMRSVNKAVAAEWKPSNVFGAHLHNPYLGPWITRLRVTVAATGELRDVVVDSSSGLAPFDDEAVRTFRAIERFPPPPPGPLDRASESRRRSPGAVRRS